MSVRVLWVALFAWLAVTCTASAGSLPYCRSAQDASSPMVFAGGFGASTCNTRRAPRYHIDDYAEDSDSDAARSSDPMVWSDDRWASDLFGYRRSYDDAYDRRFHARNAVYAHATRRVVEIELQAPDAGVSSHGFKTGVINGSHVDWTVHRTIPRATDATPSGARVWSGGMVCANCGNRNVVGPTARCGEGGALLITWTGKGAQYRCTTPRRFHRWVR